MFIIIENNVVSGIYCGDKFGEAIDVPDSFEGNVGQSIFDFDENWNLIHSIQNYDYLLLRKEAYKEEADPLFFMSQRGECSQEDWKAKIREIKLRYPKERNHG